MSENEPLLEGGLVSEEVVSTGSQMKIVGGEFDANGSSVQAEFGAANINYQSGEDWGLQASVHNASAEAHLDDEGYSGVGATYDEWEVAASVGPPDGDPASTTDVYAQFAYSQGEGARFGIYHGADQDKDGELEYGVRADWDDYGVDIRVEAGAIRQEYEYAAEATSQAGEVLADAGLSLQEDAEAVHADAFDRMVEAGGDPVAAAVGYVSDGVEAAADFVGDLLGLGDDDSETPPQ